jgi:linoleate 10R-lipoxygenase
MARLPDDFGIATKMQHKLIDILYKDLPHPPASYVTNFPTKAPIAPKPTQPGGTVIDPDNDPDYAFRTYDGCNYNVLIPNMGRAGMPYARSVPALNPIPADALPDPGLVFDSLLKVCKLFFLRL